MFDKLIKINEEKNAEKVGIKTMSSKPLTMENTMGNSNKPGLLAKANFHSKNALGNIGRPVAVGTGIGVGAWYAGQKWDVEFLQDGYNCLAVGVVGAAGVEIGLATFGDDTDLRTAAALSNIKEAIKEDQKGTLADRLIAAGASESDASAVALVSGLFNAENESGEDEGKDEGNQKKRKSS